MYKVKKYLPFNVCDFYGYLFPGAILTTVTFLLILRFSPLSTGSLWSVVEKAESLHLFLSFVGGAVFVAFVYFVGHINAAISHLVFDQIFVKRVVGYPIIDLISVPKRMRLFNRAYNFYIIVLCVVIVILPVMKLILPEFDKFPYVYMSTLVLLGCVLLWGALYSLMSGHKAANSETIQKDGQVIDGVLSRCFCSVFVVVRIVLSPMLKLLFESEKVSKCVVVKFKRNITSYFGVNSNDIGSDNFWLPYIYMHRFEPEVEEHLSNWMNLYAFLKNLALVSFTICFEISLAISLHSYDVCEIRNVSNPDDVLLTVAMFLASFIISWVFAVRYWNIYSNYFTKYLIRTFSTIDGKEICSGVELSSTEVLSNTERKGLRHIAEVLKVN